MMADLTPDQIDLLLAVTDGSLEGQELADARARVEADPILSEELRLQELAVSHLARERVAPMADFEAARMRREVLDEVLPQKPERAPWFARLVPAAAVLALVVAGVGFFGSLGSSDTADSAQDELAAVAPAETESMARSGTPEMESAPAADDAFDMAGDAAMEAPMDDADEEDIVASAVPKLDLPLLGVLESGPLSEVQLEDLRASLGGAPTPVFMVVPNCDGVELEEALVLDVIGAGIASSDDLDVRVLLTEDDVVLVVDPETCDLVGTR